MVPAADLVKQKLLTQTEAEGLGTSAEQAVYSIPNAGAFKMVADPAQVNWVMTIAILTVLVIYVTMVYGPIAAILVEMFPTRIRYTGMSLPYHIGNGWFGGLLPAGVFALSAASGDIYYGLWYPIVIASITFVVGLLFVKETRGRPASHRLIVRQEWNTTPPFGAAFSYAVLRFDLDQFLLAPQAAAIAGQRTVRADHTVAGNDDPDLVGSVRARHRPHGQRFVESPGNLAVTARLPCPDIEKLTPDILRKGAAMQHKRQVEGGQPALEKRVQLPFDQIVRVETARTEIAVTGGIKLFNSPGSALRSTNSRRCRLLHRRSQSWCQAAS